MAKLRRLAALGAAAEAARRYAQKNPDKVREIAGKAAKFADQQTKGKYTNHINTAVTKAAEVAGVGAPAPVSPIRPVATPPAASSAYIPPAASSQYTAPGQPAATTPPGTPAEPTAASGTPAPQRPKPTPFKRDGA